MNGERQTMNGHSLMTGVRHQMNVFCGALMFLTRIPVGKRYVFRSEDLPRSAVYFPVVGLLIGLLAGSVLFCAEVFMPSGLAVLLCMAVTVLVTGALHEDGLADAADGLAGSHDPRGRLDIMRDSRLGTYGAVALWFSLTAKLLLLTALLQQGVYMAIYALIVAHGVGRASTVALLFSHPYMRNDASKASPFGNSVTLKELVIALVAPVIASILLLGSRAILLLITAAAATWAAGTYFRRKIGGITGDCLGAANQLVELVCYLSLVVRFSAI
jgi:adenosylcobinamide-GDP ribazoletransferase